MNSKRAKRIMKQARKNSRTGKTIISAEYDRLKKLHMNHSVTVKPKRNKRQERLTHESSARIRGRAREERRQFRPKEKAHNF